MKVVSPSDAIKWLKDEFCNTLEIFKILKINLSEITENFAIAPSIKSFLISKTNKKRREKNIKVSE